LTSATSLPSLLHISIQAQLFLLLIQPLYFATLVHAQNGVKNHAPVHNFAAWFKGYGGKREHLLYSTTNNEYGMRPPTVHTMPSSFFDRPQKFTNVSYTAFVCHSSLRKSSFDSQY
jgi:hypothetical protein